MPTYGRLSEEVYANQYGVTYTQPFNLRAEYSLDTSSDRLTIEHLNDLNTYAYNSFNYGNNYGSLWELVVNIVDKYKNSMKKELSGFAKWHESLEREKNEKVKS